MTDDTSTAKQEVTPQQLASEIYAALATNDDVNSRHKDTIIPMIARIISNQPVRFGQRAV